MPTLKNALPADLLAGLQKRLGQVDKALITCCGVGMECRDDTRRIVKECLAIMAELQPSEENMNEPTMAPVPCTTPGCTSPSTVHSRRCTTAKACENFGADPYDVINRLAQIHGCDPEDLISACQPDAGWFHGHTTLYRSPAVMAAVAAFHHQRTKYSLDGDLQNNSIEHLIMAGIAYSANAMEGAVGNPADHDVWAMWPWAPETFKPRSPRENLLRAAAFMLASVEYIDASVHAGAIAAAQGEIDELAAFSDADFEDALAKAEATIAAPPAVDGGEAGADDCGDSCKL